MEKNLLSYKNYFGSVDFSADDEVFFGKIEGINDLVTFEGTSINEIKTSFKEAVDDYLEMCKKLKKSPDKTFKGSFNVRIPPTLHKLAFQKALKCGISLNQFVKKSIEDEILSITD